MCTVSAFYERISDQNNSLVVTMNRDEQRTRHEGEPFISDTLMYPVDVVKRMGIKRENLYFPDCHGFCEVITLKQEVH